jgi:hypothetical protein
MRRAAGEVLAEIGRSYTSAIQRFRGSNWRWFLRTAYCNIHLQECAASAVLFYKGIIWQKNLFCWRSALGP